MKGTALAFLLSKAASLSDTAGGWVCKNKQIIRVLRQGTSCIVGRSLLKNRRTARSCIIRRASISCSQRRKFAEGQKRAGTGPRI